MVFQDPMNALTPHLSIGRQLGEVLLDRGLASPEEACERSLAALQAVGLADAESRLRQYPHELSGGQRQRVAIAMALMTRPELLIADEPTTALDVTVQAQVLQVLRRARRDGLAMVLITHDLGVVAGIADRVAIMYAGRIVEIAPVRELFAAPAHPYTAALLEAVPRLSEASEADCAASKASRPRPARSCRAARSRRAARTSPRSVAARLPALRPGATRAVACHVPRSRRGSRAMSDPLLQVSGLGVRFPVRRQRFGAPPQWLTALDDVHLEIEAGRSLGVVGESGCGKSTLARAILALVEPHAGEIRWRGAAVRRSDPAGLRRMRRELQVVFQDPFGSLDPRMSIGESVAEALDALEGLTESAAVRTRVAAVLEEVGLDPSLARRYPHELSGGQCQRAAIARATVVRPRLLICDEAVSALDVSVQAQIVNLLSALSARHGMALLFISHNLAVVRHLCDEVLVLYLGHVVERGPRESVFSTPRHPYTRALLAAVPEPDPAVRACHGTDRRAACGHSGAAPDRGCVFQARCPHADALCASQSPTLAEAGPAHVTACHHWRVAGSLAGAASMSSMCSPPGPSMTPARRPE